MPSRSQLPSKIKRDKFILALCKLGFEVSTKGGKGSHFKIIHIQTQKAIIVQGDLRKDVLYYLLKQIEDISGVTWEKIKEQM